MEKSTPETCPCPMYRTAVCPCEYRRFDRFPDEAAEQAADAASSAGTHIASPIIFP